MLLRKIPAGTICFGNLIQLVSSGDEVASSRIHVGSTTASLPYLAVAAGTGIKTLLSDLTFGDRDYKPHCMVSTAGTVPLADANIISYMLRSSEAVLNIPSKQLLGDLHANKLAAVFPGNQFIRLSKSIRENKELVVEIVSTAWDLIIGTEHRFRHYIQPDGQVVVQEAASLADVLKDLALITGEVGWKIPNILVIILDILLGSHRDKNYYHLCGPAMWDYIEKYDYPMLLQAILEKMKRYGRHMHLVNIAPFKVFSLRGDKDWLDALWLLWKKSMQEPHRKEKVRLESKLIETVRAKQLPWYDGCSGKAEITQHDLGAADEIYVPTWAIWANLEELSTFVTLTTTVWKSRKR